MTDGTGPRDWDLERNVIHSTLADTLHEHTGHVLAGFVVVAVTLDEQGRKSISCWTPTDQRHWETLGMIDFVRLDTAAMLAEQRINPEGA